MRDFPIYVYALQSEGGSYWDAAAIWHLDMGEGSTAYDSTPNENHGTIHGASWVEGRYGYTLSFDGIDDYVGIPGSSLSPSSITISAWIKLSATGDTQYIVDRLKGSTNAGYILAVTKNGRIRVLLGNGTTLYIKTTSTLQISWDTWHHIAVTYNTSSGKVYAYLDGVQEELPDFSGNIADANRALQISSEWFSSYVKGIIDEVRIYNRALTKEEIWTLYEEEFP